MTDKHFVLFYEYAPDIMERRDAFRAAHLGLANEAAARGELVLGGAFLNPVDAGILVFKAEDASVAEAFAKADPYVVNGLVTSWRVREWMTVVGEGALNPVTP